MALLAVLAGCSSPRDNALDEFSRWYDGARAQAQAGAMKLERAIQAKL